MGERKKNPVNRVAKRARRAEIRRAVFPAAYEYVKKNFSPWHCEQIYRKDGKVLKRMDLYKMAFRFFEEGVLYASAKKPKNR